MSTYDDDYSVDDLDRITLETHTKDSRRQCVPLGRDEDWGGDGVFLDGQPDVQRRLLKGGAKFPFASWWICKDTNATEGTSPSALSAFCAWRLKTSSKKGEVTVTPFLRTYCYREIGDAREEAEQFAGLSRAGRRSSVCRWGSLTLFMT